MLWMNLKVNGKMNYQATKNRVTALENKKAIAEHCLKTEKVEQVNVYKRKTNIEKAQQVIQHVSQQVQQQAHKQIAGVVSRCLESVFEETYKFNINFALKRGKTEARLTFEKYNNVVDPMTASGGGVVDVAAFALRLACLMLSRPQLRKVLIMDEPFKFVSVKYRDNVRLMLEALAVDFGIQFIIITHMDELRTGKVIKL